MKFANFSEYGGNHRLKVFRKKLQGNIFLVNTQTCTEIVLSMKCFRGCF